MLSCTLVYLEKDMSLNTDSLCNETNNFQTAAGLSYPLKHSCGGVTWNMFLSQMLFSFDVCANACANAVTEITPVYHMLETLYGLFL